MCYHKKARNTNNGVLEPELSHAFSKWIFWHGKLWIVATKVERSRPVQKLTPCPFFSPSSLYETYSLHWKNRGINCGEIKFSGQLFSQFLYWSLSGVKNPQIQGWITVSENKMVYFLWAFMKMNKCFSTIWMRSLLFHKPPFGRYEMESGSREIMVHWPPCVWKSLWKSKCIMAFA